MFRRRRQGKSPSMRRAAAEFDRKNANLPGKTAKLHDASEVFASGRAILRLADVILKREILIQRLKIAVQKVGTAIQRL